MFQEETLAVYPQLCEIPKMEIPAGNGKSFQAIEVSTKPQWRLPPKPDGSTDRVRQAGCSFGRITNVQTDPRAMEFALNFFW